MPDFIAYNSKRRVALMFLVSILFVIFGLLMVGVFGEPRPFAQFPKAVILSAGWSIMLFCSLCSLQLIRRFFDTRDQLTIGPDGIRSRPWSDDTIPWSAITRVTIWRYKRQRAIILHLRNPARFPERSSVFALLGRANSAAMNGGIYITMSGTNRSVDEAIDAIARYKI